MTASMRRYPRPELTPNSAATATRAVQRPAAAAKAGERSGARAPSELAGGGMEEGGLAPPPAASLTRIRKASRYW
uniref:Uncharacterized protein n=1 Tax=Arundo donax TaxID=35708 RepID=A0A0A9EQS3_ARUDO